MDAVRLPPPPPPKVELRSSRKDHSARNWTIAIVVIVGAIIFGAMTKNASTPGGDSGDALTEGSSEVDWENYAPEVKTRIDGFAGSGDCAALQQEFDIADANDDLQRDRVGDGNADLMDYIDEKMADAGCYG